MFEHQADTFLLLHQPTDNIAIPSMKNYAEYDDIDGSDESEVPGSTLRISDNLGTEGLNPEDIPILLPSTLGWEWCTRHGVKSLAEKEAKLRYAQATDSIRKIQLALGFKSALFRTHVRVARTQQTKTRAWTAIHGVDTTVHEHARNYSMARDAYLKVVDVSGVSDQLQPLLPSDLQVKTTILGAAQVGQRNTQLSWIWSFGISAKKGATWFDECKCPAIWIT